MTWKNHKESKVLPLNSPKKISSKIFPNYSQLLKKKNRRWPIKRREYKTVKELSQSSLNDDQKNEQITEEVSKKNQLTVLIPTPRKETSRKTLSLLRKWIIDIHTKVPLCSIHGYSNGYTKTKKIKIKKNESKQEARKSSRSGTNHR